MYRMENKDLNRLKVALAKKNAPIYIEKPYTIFKIHGDFLAIDWNN